MDVSIGWWTKSLLKKMVGNHQTSIHENIAWLSGPVCPALPGLWGSCAKHHENCYQMRWFQSFFVEFSSRCSWGQWFPIFDLRKNTWNSKANHFVLMDGRLVIFQPFLIRISNHPWAMGKWSNLMSIFFSDGLKTSTKHTSQYFIYPILRGAYISTTRIPYWSIAVSGSLNRW